MRITSEGVAVTDLVAAIKSAIVEAGLSASRSDREMRVVAVQLTLNTIATEKGGGKLEFKVPVLGMAVKLGRSATTTDTHTIEMTLVPPDLSSVHEVRGHEVEEVLVEAIETVRDVMAAAVDGDEPFVLKESSVELVFAVTEEGTISLGVESERSDETTHKLKLMLAATGAS
jgi:hypothetical protein